MDFDLESKMMDCWAVVDDIKFLYEEFHDGGKPMSPDQQANLLLGLHQMYELKFERLWDEFEKVCGHGGIFLSESEVLLCRQHRDYDRKLDSKEFPTREDIIGQNGNDGLHYDSIGNIESEETQKKLNLEEYLLRLRQWDD